MNSPEHTSPDRLNPLDKTEAEKLLLEITTAFRVGSEAAMGENKPYFHEQLRRITSRMDVFDFAPKTMPTDRAYDGRRVAVFLPALGNNQQEGLLAAEEDEYADRELCWRVARTGARETLFWECTLSDWYVELRQTFVDNADVTPEMIDRYFRFEDMHPDDKSLTFAPDDVARVTKNPGVALSYHDLREDITYPDVPLDIIKKAFQQIE